MVQSVRVGRIGVSEKSFCVAVDSVKVGRTRTWTGSVAVFAGSHEVCHSLFEHHLSCLCLCVWVSIGMCVRRPWICTRAESLTRLPWYLGPWYLRP